MSKPIQRPKQYVMNDIYQNYVQKLLVEHPTWWSRYEPRVKRSNCYIYAKEGNKVVLKMSWFIWKDVIETYFHKAKDAIIHGETLRLGANLGKIRGVRIERNFSKPLVNWHETFSQAIPGKDGKLVKIFYTTEDYVRIEWAKFRMLPNETHYYFQPASKNVITGKGFKAEFSKANTLDPTLKYKYKYYPLKNLSCNTDTQV